MQVWIGFQVFLFPFLSLTTPSGIGFSSLLFLLSALCVPRKAWAALTPHWKEIRWVVAAFWFQFALAIVAFLIRPEAGLDSLDKPSRMLLCLSCLALVLLARPSASTLWWGVVAGSVAALPFVAWQRIVLQIERPGGFLNAITFGDLALVLGLVALTAAIDYRHHTRKALLAGIGALAGLAACMLTGTRGAWVALALAALLFLSYAQLLRSRKVRLLLAGSFALVGAAFFVPATGMQERALQGVDDVQTWVDGGNVFTNVGTRLELWKGAAILIEERPLFGLDRNTVRAEIRRLVEQGTLDPAILSLEHLHNDALQALATGGVFGLAAWIGILAAPFVFFARQLGSGNADRALGASLPQFAPALAGMLVVLCYFSFGLTEVIFWSLKGSMFYALMVFLLMGFCLATRPAREAKVEQRGN
ncbi:O-antigen ligase family protein [Massilia sp. CFBP9026]|uniref:O-antigen ligase family protein n=1 Tax=Massilia sp. CFBP9026 TaxID=3096536 RepID=UPI002A6ABCB7|nr:O-antigen ligase family protein [Massilia sp. CFBP9026]MDY0962226.1 O-antigen ligase family protein [Massilia sp. CFBP9026]